MKKSENEERSAARPNLTVWVVEDNAAYRRALTRLFERTPGIACRRQFGNAELALGALGTEPPPDALLLDVELPGMNGLEAIGRIKAIAASVTIVMLTVFDDGDKVFRAICAGASGYLLKTAPADKIVESVREAVAGGAPLSPPVARAVLGMFAHMGGSRPADYGLSPREQEVLELMTQGLVKKEIADRLAISYHTVDTHLRNIYTKLHVNTRGAAVAKALKERLVS